MTWNRICQLTADLQILTNLSFPTVGNNPTISSTKAHTGTFSYRLPTNPRAFGYDPLTPKAINRVSYWINHNGLGSADAASLYIAATATNEFESPNLQVRIDALDGELRVYRPSTVTVSNVFETLYSVAIPASLTTVNDWINIAVYHYANISGILKVLINGVLIVDYAGDTRMYGQGSGVPTFSSVPTKLWIMGAHNTATSFPNFAYIDDVYMDNSDDEVAYSVIPPRYFYLRSSPTAGHDAAFTPLSSTNVSNIDEVPADGDTTYNKALAASLKDTFNFSDVTIPSDKRIIAEIPTITVKNLDVGPTIKLHAWDGSIFASSGALTPTLDYNIPLFARFLVQPDATDWNEADANAMQWGYESAGSF